MTKRKGSGKMTVKNQLYVVLEIFQMSLILYLFSTVVAFALSSIFTQLDDYLEESSISTNSVTFIVAISVFLQLFLSTVGYYYIEKVVKGITVSNLSFVNYKYHGTTKHALHMVMIITLIESNKSLKHGFEYLTEAYH